MSVKYPKVRAYYLALLEPIIPAIEEWDRADVRTKTTQAWRLFKQWMEHPPRKASEGIMFDPNRARIRLGVTDQGDANIPPEALGVVDSGGRYRGVGQRYFNITASGFNGVRYFGVVDDKTYAVKLRAAAGQFHKTLKGWRL